MVRYRLAGSAMLLLLFTVGACGKAHAPDRGSRISDPRAISALTKVTITLPDNYDPITTLVGNPNGAGVYFWDFTKSDVTVFRIDGQGNLTSWRVLSNSSYQSQVISGFAVTPTGIAWLGINSTLIRLDTNTGNVNTWPIPQPNDNPGAETHLPPNLQGQHPVQALAISPNGDIAVALSASSSVVIFNPELQSFTQVAMPTSNDEPVSLAYSSASYLGVGLGDYTTGLVKSVVLIAPNGSVAGAPIAVADSWAIAPYGSAEFIAGSVKPFLVSPDGTSAPLVTPDVSLNPGVNESLQMLPSNRVAAITSAGIVEFPADATSQASATSQAITLVLPDIPCTPQVVSGGGTTEPAVNPSSAGMCSPGVSRVMTVDHLGGTWLVPGESPQTVELVAP